MSIPTSLALKRQSACLTFLVAFEIIPAAGQTPVDNLRMISTI